MVSITSADTRTATRLLAYSHATVDIYQGTVAALVPFLIIERDYSYSAAAGIVLASSLTSSVVQPLFGALGDRWKIRWLIPVSIFFSGTGIAAIAVSEAFWVTAFFVAVSGVGVAAYHPAGARRARELSGDDPVLMSWFSLGGTIGFTMAPLVVVGTVGVFGLNASPFLAIPAVTGLMAYAITNRTKNSIISSKPLVRAQRIGHNDWRSFTRMSVATMCRSIVFVGLGSFIVLFVSQKVGIDDLGNTVSLFVFYLGGIFGTAIGGSLARRWPRTSIMRWSYTLAIPVVAGLVFVPGYAVFIFIVLTSLLLYVPFSLHITLGQDYLPRHIGTSSGITLGLAVSVGGLASLAIGILADTFGLQLALVPLVLMPVVAVMMLTGLKDPVSAR